MNQWEVVIGIETHAQLATVSKIFSGASTAFGAEPNTQACAVDLALPGVLPVLNKKAVDCAIRFGLAIGAEVARLDEALGPDTDEPPRQDGSYRSEQAQPRNSSC